MTKYILNMQDILLMTNELFMCQALIFYKNVININNDTLIIYVSEH